MPTNNPKVSAYVPQHIFDRFKAFYEERKLSMSQAVTTIFSDYFEIDRAVEYSGRLLDNAEQQRLEALEQKVLRISELHSSLISELQERFDNLSEEIHRKGVEKSELLGGTDDSLPLFPDFKPGDTEASISGSGSGTESEPLAEAAESVDANAEIELDVQLDLEVTFDQLAERIDYAKGSLSTQKSRSGTDKEFFAWLQKKDPDHIYWVKAAPRPTTKRKYYRPSDDTPSESLNKLVDWLKQSRS